jgi:hypothetical protein
MADRGGSEAEQPLYAVALLRVALELKKGAASLDEIVASVSARMRLDESDFRAFLTQNLGPLQATAPAPPRRTPRG